ncbi:MAG: HAMP domain-containing sensor histidine kinase, partial [Myxococcota bacterium]|nr:HAMP domain-containing sensor histidine kinase [Myxococcota bacterium]
NDPEIEKLRERIRNDSGSSQGPSGRDPLALLQTLQQATQAEEVLQIRTAREQIASTQSRIQRILALQGLLLVLLMAIAALFWKWTLGPLNRLLDLLPNFFGPTDRLSPDQQPATQARSLSLEEITHRLECSLREESLANEDGHSKVDAVIREVIQEQLSLSLGDKQTIAAELAATIAHDIRNPLAAIQMSLSNLRADIEDEDLAERVERISAEVIRMSRIVTQSVESTRIEAEPVSLIGPYEIADEIIHFLKFQIPDSITIENQIPRELRCQLPAKKFRQALLNLISNSAEAIGEERGLIRVSAEISGDDLLLSITDDGPGFSEDILKGGGRALTPNNLGSEHFRLAVARRIARDSGGNMKLSNQPAEEGGHGGRVVLLLPSCVDDG